MRRSAQKSGQNAPATPITPRSAGSTRSRRPGTAAPPGRTGSAAPPTRRRSGGQEVGAAAAHGSARQGLQRERVAGGAVAAADSWIAAQDATTAAVPHRTRDPAVLTMSSDSACGTPEPCAARRTPASSTIGPSRAGTRPRTPTGSRRSRTDSACGSARSRRPCARRAGSVRRTGRKRHRRVPRRHRYP